MGKRLTKVVTRTGDDGTTGLADGSRRAKNDARIVAMGEVDELNAALGVAISRLDAGELQQLLFAIQHDLFDVGAELCQPGKQLLTDDYVAALDARLATSTRRCRSCASSSCPAVRRRSPRCSSRAPSAAASNGH